jgi:hypothetical protein
LLRCLEIGVRKILPAELFSAPHGPQQLIACLMERNRAVSPTSSTRVRAVNRANTWNSSRARQSLAQQRIMFHGSKQRLSI